mmetsp:Transcript_28872/g.81316  ORF Transcript_28872/g.81316 Transcript_28872/m.81316 type:complete len:487 (+) Transcript_28872:84-1544(+)|eukprot:CAMPEP_0117657410 /NCGR_PEP_ID=MMETSP0804-20121206/5316_1 /TAXON_ID=1074897 /ORGANISM="Tetraselmis astigmatica, Strain CCMP880" /LENGTH=486 /DNA_ID=CAMNT_0005463863 /DNA_START=38 /DNA_END=1498 /DNA_ORIENTATION=-
MATLAATAPLARQQQQQQHGATAARTYGTRLSSCHSLGGMLKTATRRNNRVQRSGVIVRAETSYVPPAWPGRCVPPEVTPGKGMKSFSLIGSTGSIGTQTLDIVEEHPDRFRIVALAAGSNAALLAEQTRKFKPSLVCIQNESKIDELKELLRGHEPMPEIVTGMTGVVEVAEHPEAQAVVTGIVGCAGLQPTVAAIKKGKDICLANKETLIAGGPHVLPLAEEYGVKILPADSEHSALFQCIQGLPEGGLRRIILTASGGAFRDRAVDTLKDVRVEDAIKHPNWSMGKKITVDSATLMNKGLEVIEAHYLYGTDYDNIEIVIHPQSIIHSMVETADSSILAQLGWPDMRLPILYTMSWPERLNTSEETWPRLDFIKMGDLTFKEPDHKKYPAMRLAYAAGRTGGTMTGVLSAANEQAVEMFLNEEIGYLDICKVIEECCDKHQNELVIKPSLDEIVHYDQWARDFVSDMIKGGSFTPTLPEKMAA